MMILFPRVLGFVRSLAVPLMGVVLSVCFASDVFGQRSPESQYRPATPTISPYVGLLQTNTGSIPNYYSLVRPRLEQRAFNNQVQYTTRVQALQIQEISTETTAGTTSSQTGKGAGFLQFLHYFPPQTPTRRR